MKVYKVTCCNGSVFLVIAKSFGEAESKFMKKYGLFYIESISVIDHEVICD